MRRHDRRAQLHHGRSNQARKQQIAGGRGQAHTEQQRRKHRQNQQNSKVTAGKLYKHRGQADGKARAGNRSDDDAGRRRGDSNRQATVRRIGNKSLDAFLIKAGILADKAQKNRIGDR